MKSSNVSKTGANDPAASAKFKRMNKTIERITKWYELLLVQISVSVITISALVTTIINYFVYNLQDESFLLPFPIL